MNALKTPKSHSQEGKDIGIVSLDAQGRIYLPIETRNVFQAKPGERLYLLVRRDRIWIFRSLEDLVKETK
jgi:bifunctional DNA-binding transcriptional regulator/antitoxin component of YhaV-PrlF toxin-antitoxin module